jgi:hypothetical protein
LIRTADYGGHRAIPGCDPAEIRVARRQEK